MDNYEPGALVLYQLQRYRDEQYVGVWITREVIAEVVRVTEKRITKRITIRPYWNGLDSAPERAIAVSPSKVRPV